MPDASDPRDTAPPRPAPTKPSKTQRKKQALEVFELAGKLAALSPSQLDRIPLDADLREAIDDARGMKPLDSARRRALKLVSGLLREADLPAIREAHAGLATLPLGARTELRAIERWRERLLLPGEDGDAALTELIDRYPDVDRQRLRQLQKKGRQPANVDQAKRVGKELFRFIHQTVEDTEG